jgi:uncharacterized Zn-finger protein
LDKEEQTIFVQELQVLKDFQLEIPSPTFEHEEEVVESCPVKKNTLKRKLAVSSELPEKRQCLDTNLQLPPCPKCKFKDATPEHLALHETGPKQCEKCRRILKDQHSLDTHLKLHKRPPKMSICDICGLSVRFRTVAKHKATHDLDKVKERKFVCSKCGIGFVCQQHLTRHDIHIHLKEKKFACKFCEEKYFNQFDLQQHNVSKHLELLDEKDRPKFRCDCCPKKLFVSQTSLRGHLTMMMNKKLKPAAKGGHLIDAESGTVAKPIRCMFCKHKPFSSRQELHAHNASVHVKYCELCNKRILSQERFEKHMDQHKMEAYDRRYHCKEDNCTARFRNSYLLLIHSRSHSGEFTTFVVKENLKYLFFFF